MTETTETTPTPTPTPPAPGPASGNGKAPTKLPTPRFRVFLLDGSTFEVQSLMADQLAFEREAIRKRYPPVSSGVGVGYWHGYLAYSAARRARLIDERTDFAAFSEYVCAAVENIDDEDAPANEEITVGPTPMAPMGG